VSAVVVAGALAGKPWNGGEAWVRLSWVLGLERLGVDVTFVEETSSATTDGVAWFESVAKRFELRHRAALVDGAGVSIEGLGSEAVRERLAAADLLFNISGNLRCESLLSLPSRRAYVDLDPGYTQFWHMQGALNGQLKQHDHFLTVALAIGEESCTLPTSGLPWRPVLPPVVLDEWPMAGSPDASRFTTVAAWRGGYGRVEHDGHLYAQKAHEFRRFADVPAEISATFEIALDIHPGDKADIDLLQAAGWFLVDPRQVTGDPDLFRAYVQQSGGEFSPSQGIYVETGSGWFSDRTARYLASGKPAVVQDTGMPAHVPRGEGLLTFRTVDEARAAVQEVLDDYERHARAARHIAEELLSSDDVLGGVLEETLS
jgi:hypothetical protein